MAKSYPAKHPQKLSPMAYRAVRMLAADKRPVDIAKECRTSVESLRRWRMRPDFENLLAIARAERKTKLADENVRSSVRAMARIEDLAMRAVDVVEELLESHDEKIRMMAARALVEWGQPTGQGQTGAVIMISAENVQLIEKGAALADRVKAKYGAGEAVPAVLNFRDGPVMPELPLNIPVTAEAVTQRDTLVEQGEAANG